MPTLESWLHKYGHGDVVKEFRDCISNFIVVRCTFQSTGNQVVLEYNIDVFDMLCPSMIPRMFGKNNLS